MKTTSRGKGCIESKVKTYSTQRKHFSETSASNICRYTVKVENKARKGLAVMSLPLSDIVHGLGRGFFIFRALRLRLTFFLSRGNQFPFKGGGLSTVGTSREDLGLGSLAGYGRSCFCWRARTRVVFLQQAFLRRRLSKHSDQVRRHRVCPLDSSCVGAAMVR